MDSEIAMKKLRKGQFVVKVLRIMGSETATIQRVESVKKGVVRLVDSSLKFSAATLLEVDQAPRFGAGATCKLVWFDDGEETRWWPASARARAVRSGGKER